ncbi:hypothetical protein TRFO_19276 [Tritrichomonas foetus]|uniref:DNA-directed RNA polymerase subunit n=1 Tax=Tritrichomonas foetus TaxID=1144522 RepID=A0A1J4KJA3_9EUKA|nr:hypothetical protein TRFO_19276 [Tritrichomonas foetus]|eukprot:OHT11299.1 hypothetical protein TRFO_19276 [Tritrichomonas foetus]
MTSHNFCPACGNLLLIDSSAQETRLRCRSCTFDMEFTKTKIQNAEIHPLDVASFVIDDNNMDFKNTTSCRCEKCGNTEAYFNEVQIRSADEPATLFFCCTKCKFRWREG